MSKVRILCRLGVHQWFSDSAAFYSADKCYWCGKWRDPFAGRLVDMERERWDSKPEEMTEIMDKIYGNQL